MQVFIDNNARFWYQSKEKVLSSNAFGIMQIWTRKDKNGEPYWRWLKKKNLSDEYDSEFDDEKDNDLFYWYFIETF